MLTPFPKQVRQRLTLSSLQPCTVPDKGAPPIPPTATPTSAHKKAEVLFAYQATQDDEVSVEKGDIVDVIDENTGQDGWWKVRVGNKEGFMPDNFLSLIQTSK